ncbi:mediator of RNA polymerase II transcription subunit 12-like [Trifolium pratense]|uniref:mediator of RNA polymerase II transcription subunit 12-like n=1 Tax=Trifolium pratense TaxID=57577 RepID=UPI001E695B4F|nr:mediator of RNA polymerase II transcription subunit 12-like [Trifolium pratense]
MILFGTQTLFPRRTSKSSSRDIVFIGKALKRLRFVEKRVVAVWLLTVVKQAIEETEKNIGKTGQFGGAYSMEDDGNSIRWKLGEDELSAILYYLKSGC